MVVLVTAGLLIGGKDYLTGVEKTTLARVGAADPIPAVLAAAWSWTGLIVLLAIAGVIISWVGRRGGCRLLVLACWPSQGCGRWNRPACTPWPR